LIFAVIYNCRPNSAFPQKFFKIVTGWSPERDGHEGKSMGARSWLAAYLSAIR
jgi:hypothetical protein